MDKDTYSRIPILYTMAFHSMSASKDDPNSCAREFLEYLKKAAPLMNKDASNKVNTQIVKISEERTRRDLMQACNLQLSIEHAEQLFPSLTKSKQKTREEIEQILNEASNQKIRNDI